MTQIQSPNERRLDGCRDAADENACRPHREPRYVIFPAANTAEAPNRAGSPQGQAHEDADTAPVAPGVKRSMSVRNLLSTPALFRRKPSQASTRQAPPSDGAVRAMTMRKGSRDMRKAQETLQRPVVVVVVHTGTDDLLSSSFGPALT